jgi:hypothetical protein
MPRDLSARVPSRLAAVVALVVVGLAAVSAVSTPAHAQGSVYYVNPTSGMDTNTGISSGAPFKTLQKALDVAQAGATINLAPGPYREAVITKRPGTAAAPITVKGPQEGRDKAVLYGLGGRVFSIDHSYYTLTGFTIDGQPNIDRSKYEGKTLADVKGFKDSVQSLAVNSKLIYVGATDATRDIVGTTISNMFLTGSGGECVRFRNRAANSLVVNSVIQWCGMRASGSGDQYKYHNAEGVYIGTSPKSTTQPLYANDTSNNIVVRDSTINTYGSECFEVKENAHHNRLENVDCGFNDEPLVNQGSNVELRGDHNTVVGSRLSNSHSWNMKLASDEATYDKGGNTAQGTTFSGAATYPIINKQTGSGPFCGNTFPSGTIADPSGKAVSSPATCTGSTTPTVTARTPAANATGIAPTDNVTATFSEAVQGVSATTFTLKPSAPVTAAAVAATFTYDSAARTATLDPSADLAANTQYTATLTGGATGIKSATGTPLATATWNFTTAPGSAAPAPPADTAAPTVTARNPAPNAIGFAVGGGVTATFSEPVQGVSGSTFTLKPGTTTTATPVAATVTYDATGKIATVKPNAALAANTQYTARLTGGTSGIRDMANNALGNVTWSFTTGVAPDTKAPTVTGRSPGVGATSVSRYGNITATFSEPVTGVSGTTATLTNDTSRAAVPAVVTYSANSRVVTLNPNSTLPANTKFTVTLTGGAGAIKDAVGNPLTTVSWSFTTSR